ncbi:DEAD/DEAH box helicase [Curtobacterium sp. MCLR17_007]|uniref:DEAD/DEAH box helicase n=1 Tax=Curtobacterium sp. MCLR17_007 TaxID=2175648 RepID=UPI000DA6DC7D|nr:DEAD/DEAH box helicase [Curtobacterium sp. MCLR17_007]WIB61435.1 DEAD/DEAH box helicase [Curtobacterium sp. MCLR17_007]
MTDKAGRERIDGLRQAAEGVLLHRAAVRSAADSALATLRQRRVTVDLDGERAGVVPLGPSDTTLATDLVRAAALPTTGPQTDSLIRTLSEDVPRALDDVRRGSGFAAIFAGRVRRETAARADEFLDRTLEWIDRTGATGQLRAVDDRDAARPVVPLEALADSRGPLATAAPDLSDGAPLFLDAFGDVPAVVAGLADAVARERAAHADVVEAGRVQRDAAAQDALADMDIDRLREATGDQLRLTALRDAGVSTVGAVLRHPVFPGQFSGVGEVTAARINGAAQALASAAREDAVVRIDVQRRDDQTLRLVAALQTWEAAKTLVGPREQVLIDALQPVATMVARGASMALVLPGQSGRDAGDLVQRVISIAEDAWRRRQRIAASTLAPVGDPWQDFLQRPASFFALLDEAGLTKPSGAAARGDLGDDLIAQVEAFSLDTSRLSASLRGYQRFAAAFALVQKRVVIGDEMGLGKTVEALATIAHIVGTTPGRTPHFLVICPAAVVANWVREAERHTDVRAFRLHGPARLLGLRHWIDEGGIGVTTYETLEWLRTRTPDDLRLASVVVDEAHYVKNPDAKRTMNARTLLRRADRAILMSGTPLENRVDEFRVLIDHIRPDLVVDQSDDSPLRFRKQIAPVYLRRRQEDVLTELPGLVEVDEWTDLTDAEARVHAAAVEAGDFHTMRQLAMTGGAESSKVASLVEIVEEARANDRKVLVFSYYRAVLDVAKRAVGGIVFGPLTGSTPASARQDLVDEFAAAPPGSVLVAQIEAGGVGLNIQAASVVIICEPQLKPTTEWQAIARSRRMGQLHSVQVHRLLSEDGVDAALVRMLARKAQTFEDFAAVSETATSSAQAVDVSDSRLVAQVLAEERQRLAAMPTTPRTEPEQIIVSG